ncbi:hypothetical protein RFI_24702 [Reticulomyxa filosa]|uniref:Uncharacterized protein n=1 Tax=Reticulomyxa filosa TaxID=46433 RepID=X6MFI8_RETFI|nr:hypothetical protein RFI_24702 [Reticulomyxa filosa]|eukprot:ETO12674.1 hypothetical protein RFI_24702 [Reticulomyxa filosa]
MIETKEEMVIAPRKKNETKNRRDKRKEKIAICEDVWTFCNVPQKNGMMSGTMNDQTNCAVSNFALPKTEEDTSDNVLDSECNQSLIPSEFATYLPDYSFCFIYLYNKKVNAKAPNENPTDKSKTKQEKHSNTQQPNNNDVENESNTIVFTRMRTQFHQQTLEVETRCTTKTFQTHLGEKQEKSSAKVRGGEVDGKQDKKQKVDERAMVCERTNDGQKTEKEQAKQEEEQNQTLQKRKLDAGVSSRNPVQHVRHEFSSFPTIYHSTSGLRSEDGHQRGIPTIFLKKNKATGQRKKATQEAETINIRQLEHVTPIQSSSKDKVKKHTDCKLAPRRLFDSTKSSELSHSQLNTGKDKDAKIQQLQQRLNEMNSQLQNYQDALTHANLYVQCLENDRV